MLVISRKPGDKIVMENGVVVTVLGIQGTQAKIGVDAPKDIPVHRSEIYDRIHTEEKNNKTFLKKIFTFWR